MNPDLVFQPVEGGEAFNRGLQPPSGSDFGFRISGFFRASGFGFRISNGADASRKWNHSTRWLCPTLGWLLVCGAVIFGRFDSGAGEVARSVPRGILRYPGVRQLPTAVLERAEVGVRAETGEAHGVGAPAGGATSRPAIQKLFSLAEAGTVDLRQRLSPLPGVATLTESSFAARRFGRLQFADGSEARFNPEIVLVKLWGERHVGAVRTEAGRELETALVLAARAEVEFAELDVWHCRQFVPDDPQFAQQWHHAVIGSPVAWEYGRGRSEVRLAIVDTPFQMAHPDLAAHVVGGWDVVVGLPVTNSAGFDHPTLCAGMAAAVINNGAGLAGVSDCSILPIVIAGATSQMYDAVVWAADHGVRVVSISWEGANSDSLNVAGAYLRTQARGLLFMAGVNGSGSLDYPNQPDIWCVSMTDAADNMRSRHGAHIDFAAPGWAVVSTLTGGGYGTGSGTSYATPLVAGIAGVLMSLNPALSSEEVIAILKSTAVDLGAPGWDRFFGWGRVDFGAAAAAAAASVPGILRVQSIVGGVLVVVPYHTGWSYTLWRSELPVAGGWQLVLGAQTLVNGEELTLCDPSPPAAGALYRVGFGSW
jgi:subtilisin family serine protease